MKSIVNKAKEQKNRPNETLFGFTRSYTLLSTRFYSSCVYEDNVDSRLDSLWFVCVLTGDAFSEEAERKFEKYPGQLNNEIS